MCMCVYVHECVCVFVWVALLHPVLACHGVAILRVVPEGHVDADEGRPVSRQHLTPDN